MRDQLLILTSVASLFCVTASAAEWFVSPDGTDADGRGAEAEPFRTINYAVGKASANDTIILLPGDHVEGSTSEGDVGLSRANVTKTLTIRSKNGRASRDTTRIVGAYATGSGYSDPFGELRELHVAFPEHFVEIDGDHIARLLSFAVR